MREKCFGIKTSIIIFITGISFSVIFQFNQFNYFSKALTDYLVMLFGGIAASAIVTLIIYSSEYRSIKIPTLEHYWDAQLSLLYQFLKIKYFDFDVPLELLQKYYSEQTHNQKTDLLRSHLSPNSSIPNESRFIYLNDALYEWSELLSEKYLYMKQYLTKKEYQNFLTEEVKVSAEKHLSDMNQTLKSYCALCEYSYTEMEKSIGQICYFKGKKHWKQLYSEIHEPMREHLKLIKDASFHFNLYLSGESNNIAVVLHYLYDLQNVCFTIEHTENEDFREFKAYNTFYDEMDRKLETFRSDFYNSKPEYQDKVLIYSSCIPK